MESAAIPAENISKIGVADPRRFSSMVANTC